MPARSAGGFSYLRLFYQKSGCLEARDVSVEKVGVAGGGGSRVLILLDGHPMLSADGGEIIWEALPLLDVDRVEVVKGAYSAVYGSNALGGVANIITAPIDRKPETVARVHYGLYQIPGQYQFQSGAPSVYGVELQQSGSVGGVGVRLDGSREMSQGETQNGWCHRWFLRGKVTAPAGARRADGRVVLRGRGVAGGLLEACGPDRVVTTPTGAAAACGIAVGAARAGLRPVVDLPDGNDLGAALAMRVVEGARATEAREPGLPAVDAVRAELAAGRQGDAVHLFDAFAPAVSAALR